MKTTIKYASKTQDYSDMILNFVGEDANSITNQIIDFEGWWEETNEVPIESQYKSYYLQDDRYQNAYQYLDIDLD